MITSEFPPTVGGIGYYVFNLGKKLVEKGHQITVITRGYWKKQHQSINGMEVFRVYHLPLYPFHLQFHGILVQKLLKSMERDLDIVHMHLPGVHHFYTSRKERDAKELITLHPYFLLKTSDSLAGIGASSK